MSRASRYGREPVVVTLVLTAVAAVLLAQTLDLGRVARFVPMVVVPVTLGLLVVQLVRELRPRADRPTLSGAGPAGHEAAQLAWIGLLPVLIVLAGLTFGVPLHLFLYLKARSRLTWVFSCTCAMAAGVFLYLVFGRWLGTGAHGGLIGRVFGF